MSARPLVMFAFADPDPARPLREIRREKDELREVLDPMIDAGALDRPELLEDATASLIVRAFQRKRLYGHIRAFHFSGHASRDELMLSHVYGPDRAPAGALADYLGAQPGLELVVLNACSTQPQVDRLLRAGIRGVVATSRAIRDDVAADFGVHFWSQLQLQPLRRAFDAAIAATQFTESGRMRQVWSDRAPATEGELPWQLECVDDEWVLDPRGRGGERDDARGDIGDAHQGESSMSTTIDVRTLVEQLSRVVFDDESAILLAKNAGVPPARIPRFNNAMLFWSKVTDEAQSGLLRGGVRPIIDAAARMYPHHEFFARHRSRG